MPRVVEGPQSPSTKRLSQSVKEQCGTPTMTMPLCAHRSAFSFTLALLSLRHVPPPKTATTTDSTQRLPNRPAPPRTCRPHTALTDLSHHSLTGLSHHSLTGLSHHSLTDLSHHFYSQLSYSQRFAHKQCQWAERVFLFNETERYLRDDSGARKCEATRTALLDSLLKTRLAIASP